MSDPAYPLQKAVYGATQHIANGQVFHSVPQGTSLPYLFIGDDQIIADYESANFSECLVDVHVFAATKPDAKAMVAQVRDALDIPLVIEGFSTIEWQFIHCLYMTETDGKTSHAVIQFRYLVLPTE